MEGGEHRGQEGGIAASRQGMMVAWTRACVCVCVMRSVHVLEVELRGSSVGLNGEEERTGETLAGFEARHRLSLSCPPPSNVWHLHVFSYSL